MHHVMRTDPRRRFVFGTSIENSEMCLWFFHRSHGMVTHAFNFITVCALGCLQALFSQVT